MNLLIKNRIEIGKQVSKLRKQGLIPAIIYGKHVENPIKVYFNKQEFIRLYKKAGMSTPINLDLDGKEHLVLIQDLQLDPVTDELLHVDFLKLKKGEKVTTEVSIILVGQSSVEKLGKGSVQLIKDYLEIRALPKDLIHDIKVDISNIKDINDVIFVKDLELSNTIEVLDDPEQPVVTVVSFDDDVEESSSDVPVDTSSEQK